MQRSHFIMVRCVLCCGTAIYFEMCTTGVFCKQIPIIYHNMQIIFPFVNSLKWERSREISALRAQNSEYTRTETYHMVDSEISKTKSIVINVREEICDFTPHSCPRC